MKAIDVVTTEIVVDKDGTVWFYYPQWEKFRYITDDGTLSWDSHDDLPYRYEPYVALGTGAGEILRSEINGMLIDEQPKTLLGTILDTVG